ncbi:MAG: NAD(P)H-hydrate epimerase, partial [Candidatus Omnitrophica bacterium]|nr:NAD(P)H-hydrate epimerase [Candidatus Omnitrophota bacterium]
TESARKNLEILIKLKQKIFSITGKNLPFFKRKINKYDLIVDALLGIGLRGKITGLLTEVIEAINRSPAYVVSIDIPSGLDADKGISQNICIEADRTVTFLAIKKGFLNPLAHKFLGKVVVKDLGFPLKLNKS